MTTFIRSSGRCIKGMWLSIEKASQVNIRPEELEHPSLRKEGGPFIWVGSRFIIHPSVSTAHKLKYPLVVGGISRDEPCYVEISTGSRRQAVSIITLRDFRVVVDSE